MKARAMGEREFLSWLDRDKRSKQLSLMMYCLRGMMIDDSDNGAIEAIISKLSIIYNNSQRAHTHISRAEQEIMVCQTSFPMDLRSNVQNIIENTKLIRVKSLAA